jgi:phage shock protein C
MNKGQRLTKSTDRWLAGVCGGLAEFLGWRPGVVRMAWVLGSVLLAGLGGLVAYSILAAAMPPPDDKKKFRLEDFRVQ